MPDGSDWSVLPAAPSPGGPFSEIVRLTRIDSTNRYARDAAETGAQHGLVVIADEQTAGRGRMDRRWSAPPGSSLLCSVLFRTRFELSRLHIVPSTVALAALDAVDEIVGYGAAIKWPNDLVAGRRKLAGILAEVVPGSSPGERALVVGLGLNVAWPEGWPPLGESTELDLLARRSTTLSAIAGHRVEREAVTQAFLGALRRRYAGLLGDGEEEMMRTYRRRCSTIGRDVRVLLSDEEVRGAAVDVTEDGRLLVVADGQLRAFDAGDVVHVR
ncbi:MAG TPA: biotin--[acetyl-CoA-carboxylase] ligase [Acidimicrobiales bacterium]|nr:biotin--[acetyl-CoA-carboxylase] ligase [Acidimicrobiales bacterium]